MSGGENGQTKRAKAEPTGNFHMVKGCLLRGLKDPTVVVLYGIYAMQIHLQ